MAGRADFAVDLETSSETLVVVSLDETFMLPGISGGVKTAQLSVIHYIVSLLGDEHTLLQRESLLKLIDRIGGSTMRQIRRRRQWQPSLLLWSSIVKPPTHSRSKQSAVEIVVSIGRLSLPSSIDSMLVCWYSFGCGCAPWTTSMPSGCNQQNALPERQI